MNGRRAAFLDRDGTIIHDANYVRDPADVKLLPGAAEAIGRLNALGVVVVVVTNQSGIARGYLDESDYRNVEARVAELVALHGGRIDATYMCPHHPDVSGPCDCRKPGLGMYHDAVNALSLDPKRSMFAGDRWRDVSPGIALGGFVVMLDVESTPSEDRERATTEAVTTAHSLSEAVDRFIATLPRGERGQ